MSDSNSGFQSWPNSGFNTTKIAGLVGEVEKTKREKKDKALERKLVEKDKTIADTNSSCNRAVLFEVEKLLLIIHYSSGVQRKSGAK